MIACELSLIVIVFVLLGICTCTDIKRGYILNKVLIPGMLLIFIIDVIYYVQFGRAYFKPFLINCLCLIVVALVFYAYNFWAAGDSKLLMVVALGIPGRYYTEGTLLERSSFTIVILVFSIAFIYVILESFYYGIREHNLRAQFHLDIKFKQFLISYLFMVPVVMIIQNILVYFFSSLAESSSMIIVAINFLILLSLIKIRNRIPSKVQIIIAVFAWVLVAILKNLNIGSYSYSFDLRVWVMLIVLLLLRGFAEQYNYKIIPTEDAAAGQILSFSTVMRFTVSRVKGLPTETTEDLRSRITAEEAESIHRWGTSKYGQPEITIVRKIPFAIFLCIGIVIFLVPKFSLYI